MIVILSFSSDFGCRRQRRIRFTATSEMGLDSEIAEGESVYKALLSEAFMILRIKKNFLIPAMDRSEPSNQHEALLLPTAQCLRTTGRFMKKSFFWQNKRTYILQRVPPTSLANGS